MTAVQSLRWGTLVPFRSSDKLEAQDAIMEKHRMGLAALTRQLGNLLGLEAAAQRLAGM